MLDHMSSAYSGKALDLLAIEAVRQQTWYFMRAHKGGKSVHLDERPSAYMKMLPFYTV
jgi:hypothetical protein